MPNYRVPSVADLVFIVAAPIKAIHGAVKLTQSDGDLAAHIRMGDTILRTGAIPTHSLVSYTAALQPLVAHGWLSELLFALLFRAGGLPLIAVFTACAIGITHALVAEFLRRRGVDARWALAAALISLALGLSHWLARPHMFSVMGSLATILLLESERRRAWQFFVLFALWANLHGGWLFGLLLIGAYAAGALGEFVVTRDRNWLSRARSDGMSLLAAGIATLLNPYGIALHREVLSAITSTSLAGSISEYMAPNFQELMNLPFLLVLMLSITLLAITPKRIRFPWLAVLLLSLFFALRSYRNIALFGVTAWPLIALHAANTWPAGRKSPLFRDVARLDRQAVTGIWSLPVLALLLTLGLNRGHVAGVSLIKDEFDPHTFPVNAVKVARAAGVTGRVFHPWVWGGYLMYAWPGAPLHVDPLKFSQATMDSYTTIYELRPGWERELSQWNVAVVLVPPKSYLARALAGRAGWHLWYRDSTAILFRTGRASYP